MSKTKIESDGHKAQTDMTVIELLQFCRENGLDFNSRYNRMEHAYTIALYREKLVVKVDILDDDIKMRRHFSVQQLLKILLTELDKEGTR